MAGGSLVGLDINRASRVAGIAHGGQIVVSAATQALVGSALPDGVTLARPGRASAAGHRGHRAAVAGGHRRVSRPTSRRCVRPRSPAGNLPTRLTTFVGRDEELAEVLELAAAGRLLTLTGPGGTGKTRLSLEVGARSAERYPDGVYFVPLEPITEPGLVAATIAQRLDLPDRGGRTPVDRLREHLRDRRLLIILDNFEQVIEAAPLVAELLADAPGWASWPPAARRSGSMASGSTRCRRWRCRSPTRPPTSGWPASTARWPCSWSGRRAVLPSFGLTDENAPRSSRSAIDSMACRWPSSWPRRASSCCPRPRCSARLQHRLSLLGSGSRDLPARQQTLRGAIGWSYDLLDAADRDLFGCFSVFAGPTDLGSVEAGLRARPCRRPREPLLAGRQEPRPSAGRGRWRVTLPDAGDHP